MGRRRRPPGAWVSTARSTELIDGMVAHPVQAFGVRQGNRHGRDSGVGFADDHQGVAVEERPGVPPPGQGRPDGGDIVEPPGLFGLTVDGDDGDQRSTGAALGHGDQLDRRPGGGWARKNWMGWTWWPGWKESHCGGHGVLR